MALCHKNHSFDIHLAAKYSVEEALIIHHFQHSISESEALNRNFLDEQFWTIQSYEEISYVFPYIKSEKIKNIIKGLIKKNILLVKVFERNKSDNQKWYTLKNQKMVGKNG